jgi:DNA-binding CsgD family transcriptional regulator
MSAIDELSAARQCPAPGTVGRRWRADEIAYATRRIRAGGVLVTGEPGVGRTWLARTVADSAGGDVEWVVATEAGRGTPFGALSVLLPDDLTDLHPALVLGALRRRFGSRRPLIVVDDAHLLDEASSATVLGLASTRAARLLVTSASGVAVPDAVRTLAKDGFLTELELSPFDREVTGRALSEGLGGEVAAGTAQLLWRWSRGNARHLTELVQYGITSGRLTENGGVWLWSGDIGSPPTHTGVLERRIAGLSAAGVDALCAVVLGEPITLDVLTAVAPLVAVAEIEERGLLDADESGQVRLAHPLLAAAARRHLTPLRRRRLAEALLAEERGRPVRRARWLLDSGTADATQLVAGARAVFLSRPSLAARLAERALDTDDGPAAALALSDAYAESGAITAAWEAHSVAVRRVRDDDDRLAVLLAQASLVMWCDRRPSDAIALVESAPLPERYRADLDSVVALATLFTARPARALALAERVLAVSPPRSAWIRATIAKVGALSLGDRQAEAVRAARALIRAVSAPDVSPYHRGLANAVAGIAGSGLRHRPVTTPASGRWPVPTDAGAPGWLVESVHWPLSDGSLRLARGELASAVPLLREAHVAESDGKGVFRSEAIAHRIVAEAAAGHVDHAEALLRKEVPDGVAVMPALAGWASAAVAAARGEPSAARLYLAAAAEASTAGSIRCAVTYLAEAAALGATAAAAAALDALAREFSAPGTRARAFGIRARASGAGPELLAAAEAHRSVGLLPAALRLAEEAHAAGRDGGRAAVLVRELRTQLGVDGPVPGGLTRRELEVARHAASGMTDRAIAEALVLSVRTVESHLAAVYRKLAIGSRQELAALLR